MPSVSILGAANVQCSKMRLSECRAELVRAMPSVSILGAANVQCSMFKNAIKRVQSRTCSSYAEREHFRRSQWSMLYNVISMKHFCI